MFLSLLVPEEITHLHGVAFHIRVRLAFGDAVELVILRVDTTHPVNCYLPGVLV